jgi:glycosyltransferase involved in cell wall biosynthesis
MRTENIKLFIVAGRTGHSLIVSKALPFSVLEYVDRIYLFTESKGFDIPKCTYITIPPWIIALKPKFLSKFIRTIFEPFQLLYYSILLKPDFINGIYCLPKGFNSFIVSRLTGRNCINSVIGSVLEIETELKFKYFWKSLNIMILKSCDAITIKGQTDRNYLKKYGIPEEKMFEFNGAIDLDKFRFSDKERPIDILFVGNFYELKGPDRILKIIYQLLPEFNNLSVCLVGNGVLLEKTIIQAQEMGISNNISFEGYQKNTLNYFQKSKLLLMPSRSDSLPTSMLEAMACGCVPVISNVGNICEAAIHNINAKLVEDYKNIGDFSISIRDLLKNPEKRVAFSLQAREIVEKKYSVPAQSIIAGNAIKYLIK